MEETARKASGGVRNLRAMFENRDNSEESTPSPQPNRGRSGAPDSARATHSPMSKPLNKVQTNFIAVDKPSKSGTTQWGLRINNNSSNTNNGTSPSHSTTTTPSIEENDPIISGKKNTESPAEDSTNKNDNTYTQDNIISPPSQSEMPRRRDSFSMHDDLPADHKTIQARKASIAEEFKHRAESIQIGALAEPIPEFAVETPALETPGVDSNRSRYQLGYVEPPIPRTTANPDKPTNNNKPGVHMNPGDSKSEDVVTDGRALQGASIRNLTGGDAKSMREAAVQGLKTTPAKGTLAMRPTPSAGAVARSPAAAPSNVNKPLRSPPLEKTPASPAAAQRSAAAGTRNVSNASTSSTSTAKPAAKPASSTANDAPKPTTSTARSSATGPTASAAAKKAPATASTSGTGFQKPKPKSPTRPAKLPASLMAPTASSISKVAGAENNTTTQRRRESHGSLAQNKAAATSKTRIETLTHTTSHSRPSVGPPPSSAAHKKPAASSHTTKPAGDSFLERMMRPTAASASKAVGHDTHPSPPKPKAATAATPAQSRPTTREKLHAEKKDDTPKKVAEEKTAEDKKIEEQQADPLVEDPKILEPRFSRPSLEEKVTEPLSPKTEAPPPMVEAPSPKAEAPPAVESKADAMKTEVPSKYQEPHQDAPMPSPPKASLPSHTVPKVIKTERTISVTDMENSDGTIKKLPPGAIPIPKIAKKKKPSIEEPKPASPKRNSKPDVTDMPKEKKRDFLLEVREEEKRHRRMSERPSMVKNPTTIPEVKEEADEEIDDHQLHTPSPPPGSGSEADVSANSMEIPRSTPKKAASPKKPLSPAKETAPGPSETSRKRRDSIVENAEASAAVEEADVDNVDITAGAPSPSSQIKTQATSRRLSQTAEKAMDYAAEAVDQAAAAVDEALAHKMSTAQQAEEEEAEAVDDLSKGHPLTSAMLNGSALDTDDEYTPTPSAEARGNPFDDLKPDGEGGEDWEKKEKEKKEKKERKERRESKIDGSFSVAKAFKEGEEKVAEERKA